MIIIREFNQHGNRKETAITNTDSIDVAAEFYVYRQYSTYNIAKRLSYRKLQDPETLQIIGSILWFIVVDRDTLQQMSEPFQVFESVS